MSRQWLPVLVVVIPTLIGAAALGLSWRAPADTDGDEETRPAAPGASAPAHVDTADIGPAMFADARQVRNSWG
jgi:hypothetical protein